jgi:putative endonuclease
VKRLAPSEKRTLAAGGRTLESVVPLAEPGLTSAAETTEQNGAS